LNIHSTRASLARSRTIRSARRKARNKVLSNSSSKSSSTTSSSSTSATTSTAAKKIAKYESVQTAAETIQKNIKNMASCQVSETKTEDTAKGEMTTYIKSYVENYNELYEALGDSGSSTFTVYQTHLTRFYTAAEEELNSIGITKNKNGTLSLDSKTLEAADLETMQKVFTATVSYGNSISNKCATIESNAESSISVMNKMYGTQSTYSKYATNSYYYGSSGSWYNAKG